MSSVHLSDAQIALRKACQIGDLAALKAALSPQSRRPSLARSLWHWLRGRQEDSESLPACLTYAYEDDQCNLPIHYLATGAPVSSVQRFVLGCLPLSKQTKQTGNYDLQRAAVVQWLKTHGPALDLLAVNAKLETGLHCAIRSNSPVTFQALMVAAAGSAGLTEACLAQRDIAEHTALDLAFQNAHWFMIQLLVTAGALVGCASLHKARARLREAMPVPGGIAPSGLLSLVSGVSKAFAALLTPTAQRTSQLVTDTVTVEPQMQASMQEKAVPYTSTGCSRNSALQFLPHLEAVLQHRQAATREVATHCSVSDNVAAFLLDQHQGNARAACQAWACSPSDALREGGMSPEVAQQVVAGPRSLKGPLECLVCFETVKASKLKVQLPCGHCTCDDCWQGIVSAANEGGDVKQAACPLPGCRLPISSAQVSSLVDAQAAARFQQLQAQHHVNTNPLFRWCPSPHCSGCVVFQPQAADNSSSSSSSGMLQALEAGRAFGVECGCGHAFCFACSADAHEPATCQQAVQWGDVLAHMREEDRQNATQWVQHHTQPCPGCGSRIEKNGGCNHMSCSVCRRQFCWICGGDWAKHSTDTGGYFRCNMTAPPPPEPTSLGADSAQGMASSQPAPEAGQAAGAGAGLLGSLFGKFADARARWKLDFFMRRFLAHECSERQLQVSMQCIRGLLISGTPAHFWLHRQPDSKQQNGSERQQSLPHLHHQQQHQQQPQQQPQQQQQQQQESYSHQGPLQHQADVQQQQQQQCHFPADITVQCPTDAPQASIQPLATNSSHQQPGSSPESVRPVQPAPVLQTPLVFPTDPSTAAGHQLAASAESAGRVQPAPLPRSCDQVSDFIDRGQAPPASGPRQWVGLGLNPLLHTHALQGYRGLPHHSQDEAASAGGSAVAYSQPGLSLDPTQQPCTQLSGSDFLPSQQQQQAMQIRGNSGQGSWQQQELQPGTHFEQDSSQQPSPPAMSQCQSQVPPAEHNCMLNNGIQYIPEAEALDYMPRHEDALTDAPACVEMPQQMPHRQAGAAADTQRDTWGADLQGAANAQGGVNAQGVANMQGVQQGGSAADSIYGYLEQLPQELVACRRTLQYSFVLSYYMQGSANQTRLLEGLQAQLTTLVEQLSMPLALLPSSHVLLETPPEVLQKQLDLIPGTSAINHLDPQASLQARLEAVSKSSVTEDGGLTVPSLPREVLQQQFMFAVAVQEGAAETRRLLGQMQQTRHSLLQAARTGAFSNMQSSAETEAGQGSTLAQRTGSTAPSLSQVAQAVRFLWQGWG